jgi:hypothetical protein
MKTDFRIIEKEGKILFQTKEVCRVTNQLYSVFPPGTYEHVSGYLCFTGPVPYEPEKLYKYEKHWVTHE